MTFIRYAVIIETMDSLLERELILLAEDIPHTNYAKLCDTLGFRFAKSQSILATDQHDYIKAMQHILMEWKTKQTDATQSRSVLVNKLHDSDLGALGDKLSIGGYRPNQCNPRDKATASLQSSSDIYSKKISESLTVLQCREKLVNKYLNALCKIPMKPWDPNNYAEFKDMHTVVTMVKKDSHGRDLKKKDVLQGSIAEIFSTKVNGRLPARILISAPAGRGKTTAVAKMAYDWAHGVKGSALEHLPLLFVLKLRNAGQHTSIGEAIKAELLNDVDDLTPQGLEDFIRRNQGFCHIILDGLDEYAGISSTKQSLGSNIVKVIRWEEYPECRVLVTTRPHQESFFNQGNLPTVYTKMWIEGFSPESSREYIDKFFASTSNPSESDGQGLKVYLDHQPLINELVITPLFCLMVCHLWSVGQLTTHTTTQTELLDQVNVFMMHHCNARSKSRNEISKEQLCKIIRKLGKVALVGLLDDAKKLVFTPRDFRGIPAILEEACRLGVISKKTVSPACLPRSHKTTSTTIEFYHKLAQEHSAGKYLAAKSKKGLWPWQKTSFLERVLSKIEANIGDYENLIRFAAGTENNLCITIMEAILANRCLDESERYRILLDCSSETSDTEGGVSSLVKRCVTAQRMVLKSPTMYTVVGMQNLPEQLKRQIREVKFDDSAVSSEVIDGLWSCMGDFTTLCALTISECSLSFGQSFPNLASVTKLKAVSLTSHSYEGLLSSIPNVKEIDIAVGSAENEDISQIQTSLLRHLTGQELTLIRLDEPHSLPSEESGSGETMRGLGLHTTDRDFDEPTLLGVVCGPKETVINLVQSSTRVMSSSLYSKQVSESLNSNRNTIHISSLMIRDCKFTAMITASMWTCLRSFPSLDSLNISDSSLSFPSSPPELTSVKKLKAERVTSQSYESLLSSLPSLQEIDATIDDVEGPTSQITASSPIGQTGDQQLAVHINLQSTWSLSREKETEAGIAELGLLIGEHTDNRQWIRVTGLRGRDEEALVNLFVMSTHLKSLNVRSGCGPLNSDGQARNISSLRIRDCKFTAMITSSIWSCLRSFPSLLSLTISDSSLGFPPSPPELTSVTGLVAKRVTSQSYDGLLSSIPHVNDITVCNAENEDISQIQTSLGRHLTGQELTLIKLDESLSEESVTSMSREMRGLGLLTSAFREVTLSGVVCGPGEAVIDLVQGSTRIMSSSLYSKQVSESLNSYRKTIRNHSLTMRDCKLTATVTSSMWSCLKSFTSLIQLTISDSSLSFPLSPPELTSVTQLEAKGVTSQSYEGLLSSLPGLQAIDIIIDDAERDISQITAGLRRTGREQLTSIIIKAPEQLPLEKNNLSRETMRGLSLLIREQTKNLQSLRVFGVKCIDEDYVDLIEHVQCSKIVHTLHFQFLGWGSLDYERNTVLSPTVTLDDCQLSTEMAVMLWTCLKSFTSLSRLTISDSSLSFPPSPPELTSVTRLEAKRVTSQSYEGLLSSLPGLKEIDIIIDDAERDISQITAGLRRTGGQQLTHIDLQAEYSLPQKKTVSRETMRGLGLLIREQTKNLQKLWLDKVKCTDEEDLVYLIECCRHVKAMSKVWLDECGTKKGGRLDSHLKSLPSSGDALTVKVWHDDSSIHLCNEYSISHIP